MALTTNLISLWNLETNSNDSVGGNNGSDTGVTYSSNTAVFNGSSYVTVADHASLKPTTNVFTIACWVRYTTNTLNQRIFQKYNATVGWIILTDDSGNTGKIKSYINVATTGFVSITSTSAYNDGNWHLVCLVADGSNINLYVDNSASATQITAVGNLQNTATAMKMGVNESSSSGFYTGDMKVAGFWSQALDSTDRTTLYNGGTPLAYPFVSASAPRGTLSMMGV